MGEKLRAQFWGFELLITLMLECTGKTLEGKERENAVLFIAFLSYSSSQWVSQWDLSPLQAPKPLGLESAFLLGKVVLGDGYQEKPRWRRCGQN